MSTNGMSTNTAWTSTWYIVVSMCSMHLFNINSLFVHAVAVDMPMPEELPVSTAILNLTFHDKVLGQNITESHYGQYAVASPIHSEYGRLVHVITEDGHNHGCEPIVNGPKMSEGKWIALIKRGKCKFHDKVINAALLHNASAVIVYNYVDEDQLLVMHHYIDTVVSVFIHKQDGDRIAQLVDSGIPVHVNISLDSVTVYDMRIPTIGKDKEPYQVSTLLIISVTLITCLITGLSMLLIFGIRRAKAQRRKSRRHVVFRLNDTALQQRLLLTDHSNIIEPNNNDPSHDIIPPHCARQQ